MLFVDLLFLIWFVLFQKGKFFCDRFWAKFCGSRLVFWIKDAGLLFWFVGMCESLDLLILPLGSTLWKMIWFDLMDFQTLKWGFDLIFSRYLLWVFLDFFYFGSWKNYPFFMTFFGVWIWDLFYNLWILLLIFRLFLDWIIGSSFSLNW